MSNNDSNQPVCNQIGKLGIYLILWNLILFKSDWNIVFGVLKIFSLYLILWMSVMGKPPLEGSPASSFQDSKIQLRNRSNCRKPCKTPSPKPKWYHKRFNYKGARGKQWWKNSPRKRNRPASTVGWYWLVQVEKETHFDSNREDAEREKTAAGAIIMRADAPVSQ